MAAIADLTQCTQVRDRVLWHGKSLRELWYRRRYFD